MSPPSSFWGIRRRSRPLNVPAGRAAALALLIALLLPLSAHGGGAEVRIGAFISKPVSPDDLLARVRTVLDPPAPSS